MGLRLDSESSRALELRTEGWAAGLQIAALSLQNEVSADGTDQLARSRRLQRGDRYVIDYLAAEVLRRQWYRYHRLFADFLLAGVEEAEKQLLHRKASASYEANGLGQEAIKHALAARDHAVAARPGTVPPQPPLRPVRDPGTAAPCLGNHCGTPRAHHSGG